MAHFKPLSIREWLHGPDLTYYWGDTLPKYLTPNWHAVAQGHDRDDNVERLYTGEEFRMRSKYDY